MSKNQSNKKRRLWIVIAIIAVIGIYVGQFFLPVSEKHFRDGDIAFRGTNPQLLLFTGSLYTHCGVLHKENGTWYVYEARRGVQKTPWKEWKKQHICKVMRTKEALTDNQKSKMMNKIRSMMGKPYDKGYVWDDSKIYCSELVWKAYDAAGIQLSTPRKGDTFLVSHLRYANKVMKKKNPNVMNELMVPPSDLVHSRKLKRVW